MRIACPSCDAEYDVPDSMLAGHSLVRCARCGEEWRPGAELVPGPEAEALPAVPASSEVATVEEPPPPVAAALDRPPSLFVPPREPRAAASRASADKAGTAVLIGWVLTILVLGGAAYAFYAYRTQLMAAWPPSTRLYAALGLHP